MTIREALQAKSRRILAVGLAAWLALVVSLVLAAPRGLTVPALVCLLCFFAAALAQSFFVRCPRCRGNVGLLVAQALAPGRLRAHVGRCPFCGVSFDGHA